MRLQYRRTWREMLVSGTSNGTAQRAAGHTTAPVEPRSARRSSDSKCATGRRRAGEAAGRRVRVAMVATQLW